MSLSVVPDISEKSSKTVVCVCVCVLCPVTGICYDVAHSFPIITSAEKGGYVFGSVCLSVCLSVCPSDYSQTCERILMKFFGGVGHGSRTK